MPLILGLVAVAVTWGTGLVWLAVVFAALGAVIVLGRGRQISVGNGYTLTAVIAVLGSIGTIIAGAVAL